MNCLYYRNSSRGNESRLTRGYRSTTSSAAGRADCYEREYPALLTERQPDTKTAVLDCKYERHKRHDAVGFELLV
jgi:hypothetical protein